MKKEERKGRGGGYFLRNEAPQCIDCPAVSLSLKNVFLFCFPLIFQNNMYKNNVTKYKMCVYLMYLSSS